MNVCTEDCGVHARDKITMYLLGQSLSFVKGKPWLRQTVFRITRTVKLDCAKPWKAQGRAQAAYKAVTNFFSNYYYINLRPSA